MSSSGIYTDAYKDWHRKPSADKVWDNFKNFALEYNELREEQRLNATKAGFQHANHSVEEENILIQHWTTCHFHISQTRM